MGMGQAAKESVTGRPTVSAAALLQPIQQLQALWHRVTRI
jgi:hypothetical protein